MSRSLRVLSLFSGAGGADMALEASGMTIAALCEIEPHARAVLRAHWPDVPLHGDVQALDGTQYRGQVDVVVGGSPCQDLSVAGKRAGLTEGSGTRSSLFFDQLRIWNASGATYLLWENVKGAFSSSKGADFAAVLSAIVGRAVAVPRDGWTTGGVVAGPTAVAAWRLLDLQHFGVPQRRERIVVLAARAGGVDPAEVLAVGQSVSRDTPPRFQARQGVAAHPVAGVDGAVQCLTPWDAQGKRVFSMDGIMSTLYAAPGSGQQQQSVFAPPVAHTLSGEGCDASEDGTGRVTPIVTQAYGINNDSRAEVIAEMSAPLRRRARQQPAVLQAATFDERQITSRTNRTSVEFGKPANTLHAGGMSVLTYDARGNGDGSIVNTLAGDHQNRVTDYTAIVVGELGTAQDQHIHQPAFRMVAFVEYAEDGTASAIKARDHKDATDLVVAFTGEHDDSTPVSPDTNGPEAVRPLLATDGAEEVQRSSGKQPSVSAQKVLRSNLHGRCVRCAAREGQPVVDDGALSRSENLPSCPMCGMREDGQDGRASQERGLAGQPASEPRAALPRVSYQVASTPGIPRRLMPIETERLMGWPDSWTRYGVNEKGVRYELADTPRYKLCGNGIGKEFMEWVGLRLAAAVASIADVEQEVAA